jgi:hypothetical protein
MNSNQAYIAFENEVQAILPWLQGRIRSGCGYSAAVLNDRLMQRIVEISLRPYTHLVAATSKSGADCLPAAGTWLDCGRARLELGSGRVASSMTQWIRNQLEFIAHWTYSLTAILAVSAKRRDIELPAVLVFAVAEESLFQEGCDRRFVEYCLAGPIAPLRAGRRFIVQSGTKGARSVDRRFSYTRSPIIDLLRHAKLGIVTRLGMATRHLLLLLEYAFASIRFPAMSLLARDIPYGAIVDGLDRRGLIASVVLTGSNYTSQPLWSRVLPRSKIHMVWYSQSAKPITYSADGIESDTPNLRWIRIGTLWLWTRALAEYARRLIPDTTIEAVGPILWYLPEIKRPPQDRLCIAIFDVPALTDGVALSVGLFPNYYHVANLSAFLDDIIGLKVGLEERFHLPVSFVLKTKRQYHSTNDRSYFDYLEQLGSNGTITLVHYETNMYSLISASHLVMAYPFSSPAYVADALGIPSIYYDPTGLIVRCDFGDPPSKIRFAANRKELCDASIAALDEGIGCAGGRTPAAGSGPVFDLQAASIDRESLTESSTRI